MKSVFAATGFPTNIAVALSNITIVGGAIANFLFNAPRRHNDGPLIDWDLILVMEPATILGALVGGYLNKVCPSQYYFMVEKKCNCCGQYMSRSLNAAPGGSSAALRP